MLVYGIFQFTLFRNPDCRHLKQSFMFFVVKYLKILLLTKRLTISLLINLSLNTSTISDPAIPTSTNSYELHTEFLHLLAID